MVRLLASVKWPLAAGMAALLALTLPAYGQAPASASPVATAPDSADLENLVGPIALYPDDLIGIILPASTYPLQIVEADRFLDARKQNANLQPKQGWDDTVTALLNYPDVVKKMSNDLDWTVGLGEAVAADQGAVLEAIQRFRRKVHAAGNLKTDDKQVVTVEKQVITVVQADPQVIYVPSYNPSTVIVQSSAPAYGYYPTPYPVYYYPYAPGAMFATGMIFGAALGAAWHANYHDYNVDIDRNVNANINRNINRSNVSGNINRGNVNRGQTTAWKPSRTPAQVGSGISTNRPTGGRVGDAPARSPGGGAGGASGTRERPQGDFASRDRAQRPSPQPADRNRPDVSDRNRPDRNRPDGSDRRAGSVSDRQAGSRPSAGTRDAFGGYQSGRTAAMDSQRGAASRGNAGMANRGSPGGGAAGGRAGGGRGGGGGGGGRGGGRGR